MATTPAAQPSTLPVLILGGVVLNWFKTLLAKGENAAGGHNVYFSNRASRYGTQVSGDLLPDGIETSVEIEIHGETFSIPMVEDPEEDEPTSRGKLPVVVDGIKMVADAMIREKVEGERYTLKASVHRPSGGGGGAKVLTAADLVA
jgi:hypothetical protein